HRFPGARVSGDADHFAGVQDKADLLQRANVIKADRDFAEFDGRGGDDTVATHYVLSQSRNHSAAVLPEAASIALVYRYVDLFPERDDVVPTQKRQRKR